MTCLKKRSNPRITERYDLDTISFYHQNTSVCASLTQIERIHTECNYQTKILALRQCYFLTYRSYSNFVSDFSNVLYSEKKSQDFVLHSIVSGYFQKHDLRTLSFSIVSYWFSSFINGASLPIFLSFIFVILPSFLKLCVSVDTSS